MAKPRTLHKHVWMWCRRHYERYCADLFCPLTEIAYECGTCRDEYEAATWD